MDYLLLKAGLLVLVLRVLEHGPSLNLPGQQPLQEDGVQDKTSMGSSSELVSSSDNPLPVEYLMETSPQPESLVRLMALFGMRAKEAQATDPKFWSSPCTVVERDAVDAIKRAKTEQCQRELTSVACLASNDQLLPDFIPSLCDRFAENSSLVSEGGKPIGCFQDSMKDRILKGFVRNDWDLNSPALCVRMCSRAGFSFSGVEWGKECFCGHDPPPKHLRIADNKCSAMCPTGQDRCGGNLALWVSYTGIVVNKPMLPAEPKENVSIVFLLTVAGKGLRQVLRVLRSIYRPHHFYFIHVDEHSKWLHSKLFDLSLLPNVHFASQRFSTFWASNTLLYLLLVSMKEILGLGWDFDYVMNISESDYPVRPLEEFEDYLKTRVGRNFVATSGKEMLKFQDGQGMRKLFYNCEDRMWRVGDRRLPFGLQWVGGSDWVILHKKFAHYLVYSDDAMVRGLTNYYFYSIMAPESFFHTALLNSRFCRTYENDNFRYINWNKGKDTGGCSCTRTIDWCGCSPHVIRSDTLPKMQKRLKSSQKIFFARKFEAFVDQAPLNSMEQLIGGLNSSAEAWDSYWMNFYNRLDGDRGEVSALAEQVATYHLERGCSNLEVTTVEEINSFQVGGVHKGELVHVKVEGSTDETERGEVEVFVKPSQQVEVTAGHEGILGRKLVDLRVGDGWDVKEKIFRNTFSAFTPSSSLQVLATFGQTGAMAKLVQVEYNLVLGEERLQSLRITTPWNQGVELIPFSRFTSDPLSPGVWALQVAVQGTTIARLSFLILDSSPLPLPSLAEFYPLEGLCATSKLPSCPNLPLCHTLPWSSFSPDPKSQFPPSSSTM